MPNEPTRRPPSRRHLLRVGSDSRRVDEAQTRIIEALRSGTLNLVNRYFDEAREIVRIALLHNGLDLYNEGDGRATSRTSRLFLAYLSVLERKYAELALDPRVELSRPPVEVRELHAELVAQGFDVSLAEAVKLCTDAAVPVVTTED